MWKDAFMVKSELLCRYWSGRTEEKSEYLREDIWSPAENLNWNLSKIKQDYNLFDRNIQFYDVDPRVIISRFLGAVAKLQKVTNSFFISVRPSVRMEQLGLHWKDFQYVLSIFRKSDQKIQVSLKSDKNDGYFT